MILLAFSSSCLFFILVMLDVLIIGGGPHALTLATLLSNPDQPLCISSADILQGIQLSKTKVKSVRYKNKKRQPTSKFKQFVMRTTIWFWFILPSIYPYSIIRQLKIFIPTGAVFDTENERLPCPPLHFKVVDSYGKWTSLWESQFTALNIPHLRSHTLVHTDPFNKVINVLTFAQPFG